MFEIKFNINEYRVLNKRHLHLCQLLPLFSNKNFASFFSHFIADNEKLLHSYDILIFKITFKTIILHKLRLSE